MINNNTLTIMSTQVQKQCGECKNYKIEGKINISNGVWYCSRCWVSIDETHNHVKETSKKTIISIKSKKTGAYIVQLQDVANQLVKRVYGLTHINKCLGTTHNVLVNRNVNNIIEVKIPDEPYQQHNNYKSSKQCRIKKNHHGNSKQKYGGSGCQCSKCYGMHESFVRPTRNINKEIGSEYSLIDHIRKIVLHAKNKGVAINII